MYAAFTPASRTSSPVVFTDLIASATHPTDWNDAHCVVIPKPGKGTYQTESA
jgi:hypothetical protein